eukprot:TRINITY_DN12289_c0_g1_i10.p1 TRINITY_DN12289_c0_g1~~TRINITY_DN12289_c0_g1_i10.p1  ORF type:complete len:145 (-),score=9.57 TRINITY_DN12289_c0_g1_i10:207-641(-)
MCRQAHPPADRHLLPHQCGRLCVHRRDWRGRREGTKARQVDHHGTEDRRDWESEIPGHAVATSQKKKIVTAWKHTSPATQLANGIDPALKEVEERKLYGSSHRTGCSTEVVPAVSGEDSSSQEPDALKLLGGLRQVFRWFVNEK